MSQSDNQARHIAELEQRLDQEIRQKEELEAIISEKESEAECAVRGLLDMDTPHFDILGCLGSDSV